MKYRTGWFLLALAAMPAWAGGGKATLESTDGRNTVKTLIEYDGKGALRMDVVGHPGNYMLVRDGKVYSVTDAGGQPMVFDMAAMMKMAGAMAKGMNNPEPMAGTKSVAEFRSLRDTGKTETVAGIDGRVHELTYVDDAGQTRTDTMVVSDDPRARDLSQAMFSFGKLMAQSTQIANPKGSQQLEAEIVNGKKGILRFGTSFRVVALDSGEPAAARFTLPAQPMQMPDFGSMMPGARPGN